MRALLDTSSQRVIKILEILLFHEGWMSLAELSEQVGASERSVSQDISSLQQRWGSKLNLESKRNVGYRLLNQNSNSVSQVFMELFNKSVPLRWIREILFHPNMSIDYYEEELLISRSTLFRQLPKINKFLTAYGMELHYEKNNCQLLSKDEAYLRDFCASFILELNGLDLADYDVHLDISLIYRIMYQALAKNLEPAQFAWLQKDDVTLVYAVMYYLISLIRENQGYHIPSTYSIEGEIDEESFLYLKRFYPQIKKACLRPIHEQINNMWNGWDSEEEKTRVRTAGLHFAETILAKTGLQVDAEKFYLMQFVPTSVYLKSKTRSYKTSSLFDRIAYFAKSLEQTNPALFQIIDSCACAFFQEVNNQDSFMNYTIVFWICEVCPELYQYSAPKTALLVNNFGRAHTDFLANTLENFFNRGGLVNLKIEREEYSAALAKAPSSNFDFVITTIPDLSVEGKTVFLIHDYPNANDLHAIYQALTK